MRAFNLIEALVKGEVDIEQCGVADSDSVIVNGWYAYFGAYWRNGSIKPHEKLFYAYLNDEDLIPSFPGADVKLTTSIPGEMVLIWKIEE